MTSTRLPFALATALSLSTASRLTAETVPIDIRDLLNARVVVTRTGGAIVPVKDGVDHGNGDPAKASAWATKAAANGADALPDDGHFSATDRHPEVVLNYRNDDATGMQVRRSPDEDAYGFAVPEKNYSSLWLWMMSASGPGKVHIDLTYADGSIDQRDRQVPDFYWILKPDDRDHCVLANDLDKWTGTGGVMEAKHHFIFGLEARPDPARALKSVAVKKLKGGITTFYGATGTAQ